MPYIITSCSNNYGPNQFPEKLIPLIINNIINNKPLPVYGDGNYTRDWLYVKDHALAIDLVFHQGKKDETYNIGGLNEWKNIDLVELICSKMDDKLNLDKNASKKLITFIKDRPGHDLRYAIDATKIKKDLNWKPSISFNEGLDLTIDWYLNNLSWTNNIISKDYLLYYKKQYG
jgi:dTDP-glucose 4,6-dehydratase